MIKTETYTEMRARHEKEADEFPCFFAFNDEQFKEGKKKLGVRSNKELYRGIAGMFYRKSDSEKLKELLHRHTAELHEAYRDDTFLYNAIRYELANHEYCITYDPEPTLDALGIEANEMFMNTHRHKIWKAARKDYLESVIC